MAPPSLMQRTFDLPARSHGSALSSPSRQRRVSGEHRHVPEITLYLEQKRTRPGASPYLESVQVPISSTVKDVRLKLQNLKGWHADKANCSLVSINGNLCNLTRQIPVASRPMLLNVHDFVVGSGGQRSHGA